MHLSAIIALAVSSASIVNAAGLCDGQPDGTIVCPILNANTFVLCYQGAATDYTQTIKCSDKSLTCCASAQNCVYDGECKDTVGAPLLLNGNNSGAAKTSAGSGAGGAGNSGNAGSGSGANAATTTTTAAAAVVPSKSPAAPEKTSSSGTGSSGSGTGGVVVNPPVIAPGPNFNATTACQGKPDNYWSCANAVQFTYCRAQRLQLADVIGCQQGLICCQSTKSCENPGTCPNAPNDWTNIPQPSINSCQGAADYSFVCPSQTQFTYCLAGAPVHRETLNCQAGQVCCQSSRSCVWPGQCGGPNVYPTKPWTSAGPKTKTYKHHHHTPWVKKVYHHHKHNPYKTHTKKSKKTTSASRISSASSASSSVATSI